MQSPAFSFSSALFPTHNLTHSTFTSASVSPTVISPQPPRLNSNRNHSYTRSTVSMTSTTSPANATGNPVSRSPRKVQNKRICVLSDGTWNTPENPTASNIVRLTRCISGVDDNGVPQLVLYDRGVGTAGGADRLLGGAFGDGIDKNIQDLYTFISLNYEEGDEVYMFGFSRGAYTVRSLAGMIHEVGLVRREFMEEIKPAYDLYRQKLPIDSPQLKGFREEHGDRIPITAMVCFETVGSLGIPASIGWLNGLTRARYEFHDTTLSAGIKNAIHALAIDEDRSLLTPTFMKAHPDVPNQVTAKYFWGTHGGIGGSETTEQESAKCTLRFVIEEMRRRGLGLQIDMESPDVPKSFPDVAIPKRISAGKNGPLAFLNTFFGRYVRPIDSADDVHFTSIRRYQGVPTWRPDALTPVTDALLAADAEKFEEAANIPYSTRA